MPWGSDESKQFITNVGLITSNGKHGQNIMACEWTHHVSYSPGMIAICLGEGKATGENIVETKEFGVDEGGSTKNSFVSAHNKWTGPYWLSIYYVWGRRGP